MNFLLWDDRLADTDRARLDELNSSIERLAGLRAVEINVSGHLARSKIAWKLAVYQHALLHRLVALFEGTALSWNGRCVLSAILSVRALMETTATMAGFADQTAMLLEKEDLAGLDALAMRGLYASRDLEWLKEAPDTAAANILTAIDKFDKRVPGFRKHYDTLSERCHPNSLGHNFMFGQLDRTDGTVRFSEEQQPERNAQMILAAVGPMSVMESVMAKLDRLIMEISELHHRISPVGAEPIDASGMPSDHA
jgi:hypothetical protein